MIFINFSLFSFKKIDSWERGDLNFGCFCRKHQEMSTNWTTKISVVFQFLLLEFWSLRLTYGWEIVLFAWARARARAHTHPKKKKEEEENFNEIRIGSMVTYLIGSRRWVIILCSQVASQFILKKKKKINK